jgi:hypothetical protein
VSEEQDAYERSILLARRYHRGEHLAKVTDRLREFLPSIDQGEDFRLNICRVIVSAMTDRMRVIGFDSPVTDKIEWATEMFDDGKGPVIELDLYENMLRDGEAFLVVDVDQETQTISWHVNQRYTSLDVAGDGTGCVAYYENDDPNQRLRAVTKQWVTFDSKGRMIRHRNIYYPDHIVKQHHSGFSWVTDEDLPWRDIEGNPIGVAAVHFYNKGFKREAEDAFTPQDAINKTFLDLLAASDQTAFRIFVALGWIPTTDGKPPEDDMSNWLIIEPGGLIGTTKPKSEVSFEAVEPADPEAVIKTVQQCILWASMVTNTPASRFISTKLIASDETLKQQEEPLVAKIDGAKTLISYSWRHVFQLTEKIWNVLWYGTDRLVPEGKVKPIWCHSASEESLFSKLKDKKTLGVPQRQIWREMGYDEKKIAVMEADAQAEAEARARTANSNKGKGEQ